MIEKLPPIILIILNGLPSTTTCPPNCLQQIQLHLPFRELNRSPELKTSPEKGENCFRIIYRQSSFTPHPCWEGSEQTSVCFCGCVFMPRQVWLLFGRVIYSFYAISFCYCSDRLPFQVPDTWAWNSEESARVYQPPFILVAVSVWFVCH